MAAEFERLRGEYPMFRERTGEQEHRRWCFKLQAQPEERSRKGKHSQVWPLCPGYCSWLFGYQKSGPFMVESLPQGGQSEAQGVPVRF